MLNNHTKSLLVRILATCIDDVIKVAIIYQSESQTNEHSSAEML